MLGEFTFPDNALCGSIIRYCVAGTTSTKMEHSDGQSLLSCNGPVH